MPCGVMLSVVMLSVTAPIKVQAHKLVIWTTQKCPLIILKCFEIKHSQLIGILQSIFIVELNADRW